MAVYILLKIDKINFNFVETYLSPENEKFFFVLVKAIVVVLRCSATSAFNF